MLFTIEEIKKYLYSRDTINQARHDLSKEAIEKANKIEVVKEKEPEYILDVEKLTKEGWISTDTPPETSQRVRVLYTNGKPDIAYYYKEQKGFGAFDPDYDLPIIFWKPYKYGE